jgi:hypothetical protein
MTGVNDRPEARGYLGKNPQKIETAEQPHKSAGAAIAQRGSRMLELAATVIGLRLVDAGFRFGLQLIDPKQIEARGAARATVCIRKAEARRAEALIDAAAERDLAAIRGGSARLTPLLRLAHDKAPAEGPPQKSNVDGLELLAEQARIVRELAEIRELLNLRAVMREAEAIAEQREGVIEPEGEIGDDFIADWRDGAKATYDAEMRTMWAKLLVNEAEKPGAGSRRAMNALRLMRPSEAKQFAKLGPLVVGNAFVVRPDELLMIFKEPAPPGMRTFSKADFLAIKSPSMTC